MPTGYTDVGMSLYISLDFDEKYYTDGKSGYINYQNYPHFATRAQWAVDEYNTRSFVNDIWVIGAGWGWLVKEIRDLLAPSDKSKCKGIVFSAYEKSQSMAVVGLPDGAIIEMDITDYTFPDMDMAISWNFLDSIPSHNEAKATGICNKLINRATYQMHVICMSTNDPHADWYTAQGYNIKTRAYWRNKFDSVNFDGGQRCLLVNYETGNVSRKRSTDWISVTDLDIPTCWGRVSD